MENLEEINDLNVDGATEVSSADQAAQAVEDKYANAVGVVDENQINAWKAKHKIKKVHEIYTTDDDDVLHVTYCRKPTIDHLQLLATYAKKDQEIKGLKVLYNTVRLGGSEEVINDPEMHMSAMSAVSKIFKRKEAIVKKR